MGDILFTGVISASLGTLKKIQTLFLEWNTLSGKIPSSIGNLTQMFELYLSHNKLEGSIPTSIVDCQSLQLVDISQNNLSGAIPEEVFGLSSLSILLDLSRNSFTGSLPAKVGKLKNINALDLSENNLTNEIPEANGDCQNLLRNNLSGQIPNDIQKLPFLLILNLSFNNREGEVPNGGCFQNVSAVSVAGYAKLCGAALLLLIFSVAILYWRRKSKRKPSDAVSTISSLSQVPYKRLYQATYRFSPSMLIGTGSLGSVYKGIIDQEENIVVVKVLNLQQKGELPRVSLLNAMH
ncbi:LRR-domain containing kinase-like [Trema orientale]|uniref:LRR-domain containing kinase-like n=1 Tax=Trema orientale TaxID=63057 RepID=A0A2P5B265_TREOI|nr:LRR-domain containing kinase-like [Trema orientale]